MVAVVFAFVDAFAAAPVSEEERVLGIYHWDGAASHSMAEGVRRIAETGARAARVTLSPLYYTDYNISELCYPGFSLAALAQEPDVKDALSHNSIEVFMLTVYDGASFGDCRTPKYLNASFYTAENTAAMAREYSDFTLHLYQSYKNTGKRFLISNWEADNIVYCGAAYAYVVDRTFREQCDARYAEAYDGNSDPTQSLAGLRRWLETRELGIADGRKRAETLGLTGVAVYHVPEFSTVHALRNAGFGSVLYDVLPYLSLECVSYSSYETINQPDPAAAIFADLPLIRAVTGAREIIIGEMGFARSAWSADVIRRTEAVLAAAFSAGVHLIFQWQLYDQNTHNNFGLYDCDANLTSFGVFFRRMLSETGDATAPLDSGPRLRNPRAPSGPRQ